MQFSQEEHVLARKIAETATTLNGLMSQADALGLTVDVTPTKLKRRGGKEIRQVMVKVRAELSTTEVNGNR